MATFVMVNGIPGNMGKIVAETCIARGLELVPFSLTGEQIVENESEVSGKTIQLLNKGMEEGVIRKVNILLFKMMMESSLEQFFQRDILVKAGISYAQGLEEIVNILVDGIVV